MAYRAKRKFQRSIQREAVKILSPAGLEYGTFEDLSVGGLKLWLDHELSISTTLSLEFSVYSPLRGLTPLRVTGRVVRCVLAKSGYEIGVEFLDASKSTHTAIEKLFDVSEGPF